MCEEEIEAVSQVLESGWLTISKKNALFENEFAKANQSPYCLTVNSCTAALHLSLKAVVVMPGDEVIVPSFTFVASVNAVLYIGAKPVFCDLQGPYAPLIDPVKAEQLVTGKTKAIIVVHYAGYPCVIDRFQEISKRHDLKIIEDCAHAIGTRYNGFYVGNWGDVGCFSFFLFKNPVAVFGKFSSKKNFIDYRSHAIILQIGLVCCRMIMRHKYQHVQY